MISFCYPSEIEFPFQRTIVLGCFQIDALHFWYIDLELQMKQSRLSAIGVELSGKIMVYQIISIKVTRQESL